MGMITGKNLCVSIRNGHLHSGWTEQHVDLPSVPMVSLPADTQGSVTTFHGHSPRAAGGASTAKSWGRRHREIA